MFRGLQSTLKNKAIDIQVITNFKEKIFFYQKLYNTVYHLVSKLTFFDEEKFPQVGLISEIFF